MSHTKLAVVVLLAIITFGARTNADTWTELGDAGSTLGTANITMGNALNGLTLINGTLSGANDIDLFKIFITDPVNFSASMASTNDTELYLFDNAGLGVMFNDDQSVGVFNPVLPDASGRPGLGPTTSGYYYLGVVNWRHDPLDASDQRIFPDEEGAGVFGPTGPGGGNPLDHWLNTTPGDGAGSYSVTLTGATFANPEPATLSLYGFGVVGLCYVYRRRKRPSVAQPR